MKKGGAVSEHRDGKLTGNTTSGKPYAALSALALDWIDCCFGEDNAEQMQNAVKRVQTLLHTLSCVSTD